MLSSQIAILPFGKLISHRLGCFCRLSTITADNKRQKRVRSGGRERKDKKGRQLIYRAEVFSPVTVTLIHIFSPYIYSINFDIQLCHLSPSWLLKDSCSAF